MLYRRVLKPLLFRMDPESAHHLALGALRLAAAAAPVRALAAGLFGSRERRLEREIWGLRFPNPIGLAAGFDKNARAVPALARMGFGFLEVGAISAEARPGNPRPRIFRLPDDRGLINRMGLPNDGVDVIAARLAKLPPQPVPIFANVVKTADLEGDAATMAADYVRTLEPLVPHVDGFTVNVSCPATPNLKTLGKRDAMLDLLSTLGAARDRRCAETGARFRPLIVKVSPDVTDDERDALVEACNAGLADGLVLTNTTTTRPTSLAAPQATLEQRGGLSGRPLLAIALARIADFAERTGGATPIIGVGGVFSAQDAQAMLEAGASLVEVYTGYVYEGPSLPRRIVRDLARS